MTALLRSSLALFLLGIAVQASAHATPLSSDPAASSILPAAPQTVTIQFSERIDASASSIRIYAPDGSEVATETAKVQRDDPRAFEITLTATGTGTYTVAWQVVSADDGHFTKGGYLFSIGSATQTTSHQEEELQIVHRSGWPLAITIWLELLGGAIVIGALVLIATVWRKERDAFSSDVTLTIQKGLRAILAGSALMIMLGVVSYLILGSRDLATDQGSTFSSAIQTFVFTTAGSIAIERMVLGLVVCVIFAMGIEPIMRSGKITKREILLWVLMLAILLLRARVSHAAASTFLPGLSMLMNAVHLLFKDMWIGGLIVFSMIFFPSLVRQKKGDVLLQSLVRFSNVLMLCLAIGGASGAYIVWLHLKTPLNLFTTHWGGYAIALSSFGLLLLTFRLYQQRVTYRSLQKVMTGTASKKEQEEAVMLPMVLATETLTGLAVLLFSSMLVITTPPLPRPALFSETVTTDAGTISFAEDPTDDSQFVISITRKKEATASGVLTVQIEEKEKNIGPIPVSTTVQFAGGYVFQKTMLSPAGTWTIDVTEQEPNQFDIVGTFTIHTPDDLGVAKKSHAFGLFEIVMIVIGLLTVLLAILSYNNLRSLRTETMSQEGVMMMPSVQTWAIILVIDLSMLLTIGMLLGNHNHGGGGFLTACKAAGGEWHENVPMKNGRATSSIAALGCTIETPTGIDHFIDERAFEKSLL